MAKPLLLLLLLAGVWLPLKPAVAQTICLSSFEEVERAVKTEKEKLMVLGVNSIGHALYFFVGPETFTLFFSPDGQRFCTNDALVGNVVRVSGKKFRNAFK